MAFEGSGGSKLTEFVTDHIFGNIHRHMFASIVDSKGVSDEFGEYCRCAAPGLEDLLLAGLVHSDDSLIQCFLYERAFFYASTH